MFFASERNPWTPGIYSAEQVTTFVSDEICEAAVARCA